MAFVLDNSVLISWFVPTQATAYARRIARRVGSEEPFVPALWEVEFANAMAVLLRRGLLARHQVDAILARVVRLRLVVDRAPVALSVLVDLADHHGISAYDATYIELATRRGLPLATRDERLARSARSAGVAVL